MSKKTKESKREKAMRKWILAFMREIIELWITCDGLSRVLGVKEEIIKEQGEHIVHLFLDANADCHILSDEEMKKCHSSYSDNDDDDDEE